VTPHGQIFFARKGRFANRKVPAFPTVIFTSRNWRSTSHLKRRNPPLATSYLEEVRSLFSPGFMPLLPHPANHPSPSSAEPLATNLYPLHQGNILFFRQCVAASGRGRGVFPSKKSPPEAPRKVRFFLDPPFSTPVFGPSGLC